MRILNLIFIAQVLFLPVDSAFGGCFSRKSKNSGKVTLEEKYKKFLDVPEWYERSIDIGGALYSPKDLSQTDPRVLFPLGRDKLIDLIDQVFSIASLNQDSDSEIEAVQKYYAALFTSAAAMTTVSSKIISPVSWLLPFSQRMVLTEEYIKNGLWEIWTDDVGILMYGLPQPLWSLCRGICIARVGSWKTSTYLKDAEFFLAERGHIESEIADHEVLTVFDDSIDFFLSYLVTIGFRYWRLTNFQILEEISEDSSLVLPKISDVLNFDQHAQSTLKEAKASQIFRPFANAIKSNAAKLNSFQD